MQVLTEMLTGLFSITALSVLGFQFVEFFHAVADLLAHYRNHS
ncbi:hypothetical protein [Alteribacter lacisalsi]|nr:hypothetical protein [Alteribacter lacisalsi]